MTSFSSTIKQLFNAAKEEAIKDGSQVVTAHHLVLALTHDRHCLAKLVRFEPHFAKRPFVKTQASTSGYIWRYDDIVLGFDVLKLVTEAQQFNLSTGKPLEAIELLSFIEFSNARLLHQCLSHSF
jgi:hypothetical protein